MADAWIRLPVDPTDEDLARDWTLRAEDLVEVRRCRGDDKRHSFALQLCVLRKYGSFLGDDFSYVPVRIMNHIGRQLGLPPVLFVAPPSRAATDWEHERRIREHLGFTTFDDAARSALAEWMRERADNGASGEELLHGARDWLRERQVVAPGRTPLERLVDSIVHHAEQAGLRRIHKGLTDDQRNAFDTVLHVEAGMHRSLLFRFKEFPPEPTPASIKDHLARANMMRLMGVPQIDFTDVRPELVAHLAAVVRRHDVTDLRRFGDVKRHAMIACFLAEAYKTTLDQLVEMHHIFLTGLHRRAHRQSERRHQDLRARSARSLATVLDALETLLEPDRTVNYIDVAGVREAVGRCRELQRLGEHGLLEELIERHSQMKQYLPEFLKLSFEGQPGMERMLEAIRLARRLHDTGEKVGADAPVLGAAVFWRNAILATKDESGRPDMRVWELALAYAIRDALRSGDLFLAESRHHISFWNLVKNAKQWADERAQAYSDLNLPTEPDDGVEGLRKDFERAMETFRDGLDENPFASFNSGALELKRRDAIEVPHRVREIRRVIETHIPEIQIEDLLVEVDAWCGFTSMLTPLGGYTPRVENLYPALMATLVAHGTNLGIATMAQCTKGITLDTLHHLSRWYVRPDSLKEANRVLVDYHHRLEASATWGDGSVSSSDGQRFSVDESTLLASFYPRYFGYYDRAVTVYTHTSDQFSVFSSKVISCSVREAIHVLDGLLENDTILRPRDHATDTHGFTEQLFGLCYLLGFSFMPRFRDLKDQQLYRPDRRTSYGALDAMFRGGAVDVGLIREQWDQLVRVAASLKNRTAPAHVVLERLTASSDRLSKALTMLGRLVKTTYILRYLSDAPMRDRIHMQLNRGETRHELARRLFFANQGAFRSGDYEEIMNKVSALSVLSNAVLVWNTVRIADIVKRLEASTGQPVAREELARISPLLHAHVIANGTYHFDRLTRGAVENRPDQPLP